MPPARLEPTTIRVERADSELRRYCERILRVRSTGWTQGIFANFAAESMVPKGPEWGGGNWIWNIESSCILDLWGTKVPEIIPRALSCRRKAEFNKWEYFSELFHKAPIELAPTKDELLSKWYTPSNDYVMWYAPRSLPVFIGGMYGEYLNKRSAARAAKKKASKEFHPGLCG
nr:actin cytoskeleton-regulatory complex protein [Tanacetum cinerariifolium]